MRYEIAIALKRNSIVWFHGPYACGSFPDINIFRLLLEGKLRGTNEFCIADNGYPSHRCIRMVHVSEENRILHQRIGARHETINGRLKNFHVLGYKYRHNLSLHADCFKAVVILVNLSLEETPLFDI